MENEVHDKIKLHKIIDRYKYGTLQQPIYEITSIVESEDGTKSVTVSVDLELQYFNYYDINGTAESMIITSFLLFDHRKV
ncbi:MAG: hypothetical protein R2883_04550 [Caldisericia bacterium]